MSELEHTLVLQPRVQSAHDSLRPTRAEIDLDAIAYNFTKIAALVSPARVLAVVKADAYGHGVGPVARRLQAEGVHGFGVALAEEGLELREAGISSEIVVLNGVYGDAHREVIERGLYPVVYDREQLEAFAKAAQGRTFRVHLKVDTGMGRLGVPFEELEEFLDHVAATPGVLIDGFMTHFASADCDAGYTRLQLERFRRASEQLTSRGHRPRVFHAANTPATVAHAETRLDMVRTGLALFGYTGLPSSITADLQLRPAMRLRTEVIALRELAPGSSVGYSGTFTAMRPTRVATVPVGYGDGLMRALSNVGRMLVRGISCPIIGNVSMDLTTLDVTDVPRVDVGDEVVIIGDQGNERISAEDVARDARTIGYEVLTNISRRVPRFYKGLSSQASNQ